MGKRKKKRSVRSSNPTSIKPQKKGGYSGKKKKQFLKNKREQKQREIESGEVYNYHNKRKKLLKKDSEFVSMVTNENHQLRSFFVKESEDVVNQRKKETKMKLDRENLIPMNDILTYRPIEIPLPPPNYVYSKSSNMNEEEKKEKDKELKEHFANYMTQIDKKYTLKRLNLFERNVNVWKELWKVFQFSDIFLVLVDVRHPLIHFPESLKNLLVNKYKKKLIVVLNKCDMVTDHLRDSWLKYMTEKYPDIKVIAFSSFTSPKKKKKMVNKKSIYGLWELCKSITPEKYESVWDDLVKLTRKRFDSDEKIKIEENDASIKDDEKIKIGVIGHPNCGKSTVINTLMMDSVASTSMTPGKTKKSIYYRISKYVTLWDSPGLIFPVLDMPKELQILTGLFPIAQVRVPAHSIKFVAERMLVENLLKINLLEGEEYWTALNLCEAFAEKKHFKTKRMGRNDIHRAANFMLRMIVKGEKITFAYYPPNVKPLDEMLGKKKKKVKDNLKKKVKDDHDFFSSLEVM